MNVAITIIGLFIVLPIWYYLMYTLLLAAHVDRLVWFLFYVYMVANLVGKTIAVAMERKEKAARK